MAPAREIPDLSCDDSYRAAAGKVIWTRFEEMMSFRDAAVAGADIEGIHDMRVASRRLRAALEVFADALPRRRVRPLLKDVKALADALGEVRDRDVLIERLQKDLKGSAPSVRLVLSDLIAGMDAERIAAREDLTVILDRLDSENFQRRFLTFVAQECL